MPLDTDLVSQALDAQLAPGLLGLGALPEWLAAPAQPERVAAALERIVPEIASGDLAIRRCKPDRLRLKGRGWEALYVLTLEELQTQTVRQVKLAGVLTPPGVERASQPTGGPFGAPDWRAYLPELRLDLWMAPEDAVLELLPILSDAEQARALLEQSIRACTPDYAEIRISAARPRVARYKPGNRATVVYELEYAQASDASHGWPTLVVAKTYSKEKGQNAYDAMRKLWASPLSRGDVVSIAAPLAYVPEHRLLVQGPVRGDHDLKDALHDALRAGTPAALDELRELVRKTGAGLAALHQSGARHGETITWDDEIAEIRGEVANIAAVVPGVAEVITPLLADLESLSVATPAEPTLPAHRSFRPQQVLIDRGQVGFIDFDGFCLAEPALDIALFRATVREMGINTSPSDKQKEFEYRSADERLARLGQLDTLCEEFLSEYERVAPVSRQRVALWEALDLLMVVLRCWSKVKPHQLGRAVALLDRHLAAMGLPTSTRE